MAKLPTRFLGLVPRTALSEMLSATYAQAKNIDPNEAHQRLSAALNELRLIEGIQQATWAALGKEKPTLEDAELVELVAKKLEKPKRFQALRAKRADAGAMAALMVLIDSAAGYATGEARALLYTPEGEKLLARGFELMGTHLAHELAR